MALKCGQSVIRAIVDVGQGKPLQLGVPPEGSRLHESLDWETPPVHPVEIKLSRATYTDGNPHFG